MFRFGIFTYLQVNLFHFIFLFLPSHSLSCSVFSLFSFISRCTDTFFKTKSFFGNHCDQYATMGMLFCEKWSTFFFGFPLHSLIHVSEFPIFEPYWWIINPSNLTRFQKNRSNSNTEMTLLQMQSFVHKPTSTSTVNSAPSYLLFWTHIKWCKIYLYCSVENKTTEWNLIRHILNFSSVKLQFP